MTFIGYIKKFLIGTQFFLDIQKFLFLDFQKFSSQQNRYDFHWLILNKNYDIWACIKNQVNIED